MSDQPSTPWLRIVGALSLAIGSLTLLFTVLSVSDAGIDLTDEAFYLLWLRDPWFYTVSATQFGFVYHGLYRLVDGNIALLRQINFLLTYLLSFGFGYLVIRDVLPRDRRWIHGLFALGIAGTSLAFPASWLVTPSYNSLIMQSALLIGISLYGINSPRTFMRIAGGLLLGVGGVLAFQAKPTAAAAFAGLTLLFFAFMPERRRAVIPLIVAGGSAVAGLLFFAILIDGSVQGYVHRLLEGAYTMSLLAAKHSLSDLLRVDPLDLTELEIIGALALGLAGALWLLSARFWTAIGVGAAVAGIILLLFQQPGRDLEILNHWSIGYLRLVPTLALALSALIALLIQRLRKLPLPELRPSLFWGVILLLFPFAASFGTNNNLWGAASQHALFWIAGGMILMRPLLPSRKEAEALVPVLALAIVYIGVTVYLAIGAPYRQTASLDAVQREVDLENVGGRLRLSEDFANYIEQGRRLSRQAGFVDGGAILDFSGRSPGLVYVLGGKSPGIPWWISGYPGTVTMITHAIKDVSCETLLGAWLITEPGSPLVLPPSILHSFGANESDYEPMVQFSPPTGWGVPQILMRPKPELAARLPVCLELKKK